MRQNIRKDPIIIPSGLILVFGLAIGSFLNGCIYRIPRKIPVWQGRSFCPHCRHTLRWCDLLPVISFLVFRGKCHFCRARISWQYPLVEAMSAVWALVLFHFSGLPFDFFLWLGLSWLLIVIGVIDYQMQRIPNPLIGFGCVLGLLLHLAGQPEQLWQFVLSAIGSGGILWLLSWLSHFWLRQPGFGGGDIKLLALIGLFIGFEGALTALVLGSLAGALLGIGAMLSEKMKRDTKIAFAPFLALGAGLYFLWQALGFLNLEDCFVTAF